MLLSNLGYSLTGEIFNLSAEEVATEAAVALQAEKLILMVPRPGVLDDDGSLVASLSEDDARFYADKLAKLDEESRCISRALDTCLRAYSNKVHRSHLISFKENGALIRELFTRQGNGTLISSDSFEDLRVATIEDVAGILKLIRPLEENGSLVERSRELLETEIDNFKIVELEAASLPAQHSTLSGKTSQRSPASLSTIAFRKNGYGDRLLSSLESQAKTAGVKKIFVLTTVASHWFLGKGFLEVELSDLPEQGKDSTTTSVSRRHC